MKSSILHLLSLFLIVGFAASCGKKSESKGSSNSSNTYVTPTGSATGQAAYDSLKAWHASASDNMQVGIHGIYLKRALSGGFFNILPQMCLKNTVVVDCVDPTGCFKSTSTGVMIGVVEMNRSTILGLTTKKYGDCNITSTFTPYSKAGNQELSAAILGSAGKFLIKERTQQTNSIFKVFYGSFEGSTTATSYAVINVSLPSLVNPTEVGQVSNGYETKGTVLLNYQVVN